MDYEKWISENFSGEMQPLNELKIRPNTYIKHVYDIVS